MNSHYPQVAARASKRCEYCRAPENMFNKEFEVEHIIPPGKGGKDSMDNYALACRACNGYKGISTEDYDIETGQSARLFNPRADDWNAHFRLEPYSGEIKGISAIGRVTVRRLKMNGEIQIKGRRVWIFYKEY